MANSGNPIGVESDESDLKVPLLAEDTRVTIVNDSKDAEQLNKTSKKIKDMEALILLLDTHIKTSEVGTLKISRWIRSVMYLMLLGVVAYEIFVVKNGIDFRNNSQDLLAQDAIDQDIRIEEFKASVLFNTTVTCGALYNGTLDPDINGLAYPLTFSTYDKQCHDLNRWWMGNYDSDEFTGKACYEIPDDLLCRALAFCSVLVERVCLDYPDLTPSIAVPLLVGALGATLVLFLSFDANEHSIHHFVKYFITSLSLSKVQIANTLFGTPHYLRDATLLMQAGEDAVIKLLQTPEGKKLTRKAVINALIQECTLSRIFKEATHTDIAILYEVFEYAGVLSNAQQQKASTATARRNTMFAPKPSIPINTSDVKIYVPPEFKP